MLINSLFITFLPSFVFLLEFFFGIFWNFFGIFWNFFWNFLEFFGIFWNCRILDFLELEFLKRAVPAGMIQPLPLDGEMDLYGEGSGGGGRVG